MSKNVKTIIELNSIATLTDLRIAIANLSRNAPVGSSEIYFDMPLTLRLEESTLDDGGKTYNIIVESEAGEAIDDFNYVGSRHHY